MSDYESTRRQSAAPASGVLAIVLAVVAVVAGFLILRSISDDGGMASSAAVGNNANSSSGGSDSGSSDGSTSSTLATSTTSTTVPYTFTGATVIVANANGQQGSAGHITTVISNGTDFETAEPTNVDDSITTLELSQIQFDAANAAAQPVAETLAKVLPGAIVPTAITGTPPITDGNMKGAGVLLLLGTDLVDLTVAQLALPTQPATPTQTAPSVAGTATTTATTAPANG